MCRLYGFRASEPTKVECTLVHAQNALMVQSRQDLAGYSHAHGWGIATYEDQTPHVERQAWAAYHGEHFRRAAARIYAESVLAHVRRATVGPANLANTHPFRHGRWTMIHNGTIPDFDRLRQPMLEAMEVDLRAQVRGVTDSEHFFFLVLSRLHRRPVQGAAAALRGAALQVIDWCRAFDPCAELGLNVLLTDGKQMLGTRIGRSLFWLERDGIYDCEVCGFPHVRHDASHAYRATVVASEPITHEGWQEVPDNTAFEVSADLSFQLLPIEAEPSSSETPDRASIRS